MAAADAVSDSRAPRAETRRSARLCADAAQLRVVSEAVVCGARYVCAQSQQIVAVIDHQRHLRSLDGEAAASLDTVHAKRCPRPV
jgi:hypothetical protein